MSLGPYPAISKALRDETTTGVVVILGLCQMVSWSVALAPAPRRYTGGWGKALARSADVTMQAAAPPQGMTHSSRCRGSFTIRELRTSAMVMGCPWNTALGLGNALKRWFTAILANWSCVVPNSYIWRRFMSAEPVLAPAAVPH